MLHELNFTDIYSMLSLFIVLHCISSLPPSPHPPQNIWFTDYCTYPMQQCPRRDVSTSQLCADFNLTTPLSSYDPVLLTHKSKNVYYLLQLDKFHRGYHFSVLQCAMSLAPFPLLSSVQKNWLFSWSLNRMTLTCLLLLPGSRGIFVPASMCVRPTCSAGAVSGGNSSV